MHINLIAMFSQDMSSFLDEHHVLLAYILERLLKSPETITSLLTEISKMKNINFKEDVDIILCMGQMECKNTSAAALWDLLMRCNNIMASFNISYGSKWTFRMAEFIPHLQDCNHDAHWFTTMM